MSNYAFAPHADAVRSLQKSTSIETLKASLDGYDDAGLDARKILVRALVALGRPFTELHNAASLSEESKVYLVGADITEHVGSGAINVYLACSRLPPAEWLQSERDLRLVVRADLPELGSDPSAKALFADAWRGLWRLINLFQAIPGLHVELEGLDTLLPPDLSAQTSIDDAALGAWDEVQSLTDEPFHALIQALVAAQISAPDCIGDDLVTTGRVVGMMEFGWSQANVAVVAEDAENADWTLIRFDPAMDMIGDTVNLILQALEGMKA